MSEATQVAQETIERKRMPKERDKTLSRICLKTEASISLRQESNPGPQ